MCFDRNINGNNVCFKKTGTKRSSNTLMRFVPVFFETDVWDDKFLIGIIGHCTDERKLL
jgi:hypothetical protein